MALNLLTNCFKVSRSLKNLKFKSLKIFKKKRKIGGTLMTKKLDYRNKLNQ